VRVDIDVAALLQKSVALQQRAQRALDSEILRTTEPYVPFRTGVLARSATLNTLLGTGRIVWATPYARRRYYEGTPKTARHPKATTKWFEASKAANAENWYQAVAKAIGGKLK
jgi:hypothetical protein